MEINRILLAREALQTNEPNRAQAHALIDIAETLHKIAAELEQIRINNTNGSNIVGLSMANEDFGTLRVRNF